MGIDKMGIDKMGIDKVGINLHPELTWQYPQSKFCSKKEGQFLVFQVDTELTLRELMKSDAILSHLHVILHHWLSLYIILILHAIVTFFIC